MLPKQLKVVGRAGVGVDNVDVGAATRRGVIVMNTPGGNTISTAEHAFSLLVSIARNIPQAHASMMAGKWDRKSFEGVELHGKTIGIFGMGRIGTEIARRVIAFGMRPVAYDPYLSNSRARSLQVELFEDLDEVLAQSDFVTMHMPLTAETKHLINADRIAKMKRGARIVNCARGGLIDEQALFEALQIRADRSPQRWTSMRLSRRRRIFLCAHSQTWFSLRTWALQRPRRKKVWGSKLPRRSARSCWTG